MNDAGEAGGKRADGRLEPGPFALASAGYFLGPLALALVGAAVCGPDPVNQLVGALIGLGGGMGIAVRVARLRPRE